jgi:D-alanyl-D-alanine carboxypeptidase
LLIARQDAFGALPRYYVEMLQTFGRITIFTALFLTLFSGLFLVAAWSVKDAIENSSSMSATAFLATDVSAASFVVFDLQSGTILASKNPDAVLPIASVTKLVTAAQFYAHVKPLATTSITWSDVDTDGAAGRLHPHEIYTYNELLYPLLLDSSNDAAAAMGRVYPDLLSNMNAYVRGLGLTKTSFADTSGLSTHNVSSAHELTVMALDLFKTAPHVFDITRLPQFIGTYTGWINNNPMVGQKGYRGGKHGYTPEANRTIVAFFDEQIATGQTRTIGYVVLGSSDLRKDMSHLRAQTQENVRLK